MRPPLWISGDTMVTGCHVVFIGYMRHMACCNPAFRPHLLLVRVSVRYLAGHMFAFRMPFAGKGCHSRLVPLPPSPLHDTQLSCQDQINPTACRLNINRCIFRPEQHIPPCMFHNIITDSTWDTTVDSRVNIRIYPFGVHDNDNKHHVMETRTYVVQFILPCRHRIRICQPPCGDAHRHRYRPLYTVPQMRTRVQIGVYRPDIAHRGRFAVCQLLQLHQRLRR